MKPISALLLLAFIFASMAYIYAEEEAPGSAVAETVEEELPAEVAEPCAEEIAAPSEDTQEIIDVVIDIAEAVIPGVGGPKAPDFAAKMINVIKEKVEAFKQALSEGKEIHPIFRAAVEHLKVKRSTDDLKAFCISGFDEGLAQLFNQMEENVILSYCQSDLGALNELCPQIFDSMPPVFEKVNDLVNLVVNFCQNIPACV